MVNSKWEMVNSEDALQILIDANQVISHPHIHVRYQNEEAVITIPDGELIEGN